MKKKRIIILGAGISGLSAAWYLSKAMPHYECIILEKEHKAGGWLETLSCEDFLFETGPRVFKTSRNRDFLALVQEIGLEKKIVLSAKDAHQRYLWFKGSLRKVPSSPLDLLLSPLAHSLLKALVLEWQKPVSFQEESIWDFACRRFGRTVAEQFFDPLVLGIYGGDIRKLSVQSCFPSLKQWELDKGSVTAGLLSQLFKKGSKKPALPFGLPSSSLFTFEEGVSSFLRNWLSQIPCEICLGQQVQQLRVQENSVEVITQERSWHADEIFCALPARQTACLLEEIEPNAAFKLKEIAYQPITSVNVGFHEDVLPVSAFGYLVPSNQKEKVLGAMFDSKIFPQQNRSRHQTRITFMIAGASMSDGELMEEVHRALYRHLNIKKTPNVFHFRKMKEAIPQYWLHHKEKIDAILSLLSENHPRLHLIGNYLRGVSVNDCIAYSKQQVDLFIRQEMMESSHKIGEDISSNYVAGARS